MYRFVVRIQIFIFTPDNQWNVNRVNRPSNIQYFKFRIFSVTRTINNYYSNSGALFTKKLSTKFELKYELKMLVNTAPDVVSLVIIRIYKQIHRIK